MNTYDECYFGLNYWRGRLKRTMEALNDRQLPALHFDCHTPIIFNKKRFCEVMASFPIGEGIGLTMKSLYGNIHYPKAPCLVEQKRTVFKYFSLAELEERFTGPMLLSFNDQGLNDSLKIFLHQNFRLPSALETKPIDDKTIEIYIACRESTDSQIALNTYQKYFQNQNLKDMFLAYTLPYYLTGWKNFTRQINEAAHVYFNATNDGFIRDLAENTNFNFQRLATPDSRFDVMINSLADQFTDYYKHHIDKTIIYFRDRYGDSKYPNVNKSNSYNEQAIVRPGRNHRTVIQEVHKGMEPPQHARYTLISMNNTQVIQKEGKFPKNKKSEQSRTILPEMATHFSDSVDKRIWTKYGHLLAAQSVVIADALRIGVQPGRSVVGWLSRSTSIAATRYRLC
jgi:hypothetical protein